MIALSEAGIQHGLREAMKERAERRVLVLRGLLAAIKNLKIERRGAGGAADAELGEGDIAQIVRREIKQREEAIGYAEQGGRADVLEKNRFERDLLHELLPQAVDAVELVAAVRRHHAAGATTIGALMGKLKEEYGSRLDGKTASVFVKEFLKGGS